MQIPRLNLNDKWVNVRLGGFLAGIQNARLIMEFFIMEF